MQKCSLVFREKKKISLLLFFAREQNANECEIFGEKFFFVKKRYFRETISPFRWKPYKEVIYLRISSSSNPVILYVAEAADAPNKVLFPSSSTGKSSRLSSPIISTIFQQYVFILLQMSFVRKSKRVLN